MSNTTLSELLREYEKKRIKEEFDLENKKSEIYTKCPKLEEIDLELKNFGFYVAKKLLDKNNSKLIDELNSKIENLKKQKLELLKSIGEAEDALEIKYECNDCHDTGYITKDYNTVMCNCLKQKLFDLEFNKSNIYNIQNNTFDKFLSTFYSDKVDKSKYSVSLSPRENIEKIKQISLNFVNNFDDINTKNLLFTGNTGLGKTFLSSCIANELIKLGKTVLYQTAPVMLDSIIDYRFNKSDSSFNIIENILDVDLLIIDDLGTEFMNSMKFTELFNIINTRLLNPNGKITKTIISTNLSLQNLFSSYDERIVSRIIGNYDCCYFYGDDIRILLQNKAKK